MEKVFLDMEFIELIANGAINLCEITERLESHNDEAKLDFCMKLYGRIPVGDVAISDEYDTDGHSVSLSGLSIQQETEKENLLKAIAHIESVFGIDIFGEKAENTLSLPPELDNDIARKIFSKAIAKRWIVKNSNGYKWMDIYDQRKHGAKARLVFLCDQIYCDGAFPAKALEDFFCEKRLWAACYKLFENKESRPKHGAEEILKLFEE